MKHALKKAILGSPYTLLSLTSFDFFIFTYLCSFPYLSPFPSFTKMKMIGGNKKDIYPQKKSENKGKYKGETENCHVICDYDLCMYVCV